MVTRRAGGLAVLGQRARLEELVGRETFRRFQTYLELCHHIHGGTRMTLDLVVSRKPVPIEGPALVASGKGG